MCQDKFKRAKMSQNSTEPREQLLVLPAIRIVVSATLETFTK
jgi:hypothetical protein